MKKLAWWAILILAMLAFSGCGGVSGGSGASPNGSQNSKKSTVFLNLSGNSHFMQVSLPISDGRASGLVRGGGPVTVAFGNISSVKWYDGCVGWGSGKGIGAPVAADNLTKLPLVNPGGIGLWSVVEKGARESFFNVNDITISGSPYFVDTTNGLVYFGTAVIKKPDGSFAPNPDFACPTTPQQTPQQVPKTIISIFPGDRMTITPGIQGGKIMGLVENGAVQSEQVFDVNGNLIAGYQIVWNGNGDWYPSGGKRALLTTPTTTIAAMRQTDIGLPYLVRPDGTPLSFNKDNVVILINGIDVTATALSSNPGLITF